MIHDPEFNYRFNNRLLTQLSLPLTLNGACGERCAISFVSVEQGTPVSFRDGPAAVCFQRLYSSCSDCCDQTCHCPPDSSGVTDEKAVSNHLEVSQKTYLKLDDSVPSWIGAIVAEKLRIFNTIFAWILRSLRFSFCVVFY